jgi:toxin YoeB
MQIAFTERSWDDYLYWHAHDTDIFQRINTLIKEIKRDPFNGLSKPEPLSGDLAGFWSRRINREHRLIYKVSGSKPHQMVTIMAARFHY